MKTIIQAITYKSIAILLSCLFMIKAQAQLPTCDKIYMDKYNVEYSGTSAPDTPLHSMTHIATKELYIYDPSLPVSSTNPILNTIALPDDYYGGLTVSKVLNSSNPTLTYYCLVEDSTTLLTYLSYYDPTTAAWVNTGHEINPDASNIAASGSFIYSITLSGVIFKYDGSGDATLLTMISNFSNDGPLDLIGDCDGNFYVLKLSDPPSENFLRKYNPDGVLVKTWTINNPNNFTGWGGIGIINNTIYTDHLLPTLQRGIASGTIGADTVTFTDVTAGISYTTMNNIQNVWTSSTIGDFATCASSVLAMPSIAIYVQPKTVCEGETINFSAAIASGGTNPLFQWFVNGVPVPGAVNSTFSYAPNASDSITCRLTSNSSCITEPIAFSDAAKFTIVNKKNPLLSYPDSVYCQSGIAIPTFSPAGGTFTYSSPDLSINTTTGVIDLAASQIGTYTVTYNFRATGYCPAESVSTSISITDNSDVDLNLTYDSLAYEKCIGSYVTLQATSNTATEFTWYPAEYLVSDTLNSSTVQVLLRDKENRIFVEAKNAGGCKKTIVDSITISAVPCCDAMVPNAFTPNGDGLNDYFIPHLDVGQHVLTFEIYDRYGSVIFSNYVGDPSMGWDGKYKNGKKADNGVYMYLLKYTCSDGKIYTKKGDVTLFQ